MVRHWLGLAVLAATAGLFAADSGQKRAPSISVGGVVNGASFTPAPDNFVAPNGIISIFGVDLSLRVKATGPGDLEGGRLPLSLAGVSVLLGGQRVPLYFVSPSQINAQVPASLVPREAPWPLRVVREGLLGEEPAEVWVRAAAPGLFPVVSRARDFAVVGRGEPEGSVPAKPGETVVFWGTGFGQTVPLVFEGELPPFLARVVLPHSVEINGERAPDEAVSYVGQTPGLAGLYQINLLLPEDLPDGDHEIVIEIAGARSQAGVTVAVER